MYIKKILANSQPNWHVLAIFVDPMAEMAKEFWLKACLKPV
jgi:hypothetical protein